MNTNNMINPANYYNPFAKYNYVSKTRGVYMPKDSEPIIQMNAAEAKSSSIYSENYDAQTDLLQSMDKDDNSDFNGRVLGFINKFFNTENN